MTGLSCSEDIFREPIPDLKGSIHFFIDEIQNRAKRSQPVKHDVDYDDETGSPPASSDSEPLKDSENIQSEAVTKVWKVLSVGLAGHPS